MIYSNDVSNILKETYDEPVIDEIDLNDIKLMLSQFSYETCKLNLNGNEIMKNTDLINAEPLSEVQKDEYSQTKFQLFKKPDAQALRQQFTDEEW